MQNTRLKLATASARIFMRKSSVASTYITHLTLSSFSALVYLYNEMLKKIALVSAWILVAPVLILSAGFYLTLEKANVKLPPVSQSFQTEVVPLADNNIEGTVVAGQMTDARPFLVEKLLDGTPLEPHSAYMVEVADKYEIDWRLIPAIAMKESGGGTAVSETSHNAWGFENGRTQFSSWETAIDTVGRTLQKRYVAKGLTTPEEIMAVYAPPQLETGGKWAQDINYFYSQMEAL